MAELRERLSNHDRALLNLAAEGLASDYSHRAADDELSREPVETQQKYAAKAARLFALAELLISADELVVITRQKP
ncbi:hypothetical protein GCM10022261_17170 [Brevibacterium daeguense]|uniref:Uncharacterized protein n=1 Tax=Brevibacterium daeguense TaxID=909936 RepID=A0ABP8EJP9_9MICO|nr:hypothetical protein [Brevibacterium daeguense]